MRVLEEDGSVVGGWAVFRGGGKWSGEYWQMAGNSIMECGIGKWDKYSGKLEGNLFSWKVYLNELKILVGKTVNKNI